MSQQSGSPAKRRRRHGDAVTMNEAEEEPTTRKRRAFLQTMGQQLREFGPEDSTPRESGRSTIDSSPGIRLAARRPVPIDITETDAVPGEDGNHLKGRASRWLWTSHEVLPAGAIQSHATFSFEDLLDLSQSYFDHWHPAFPFIHAPMLLDYFRAVTERSLPATEDVQCFQHCILRTVLSISLMDRRQHGRPTRILPSNLVFHSYHDAISSVQQVLVEETSLLSLQALVGVQLFLISMLQYNSAARLEGLAVRMVFQLGLHRCPGRNRNLASKDIELRKRLFWSVHCIDRYICIRLGIPLGIHSGDAEVCLPRTERHHDSKHNNADHDDRLDLLEFLARHATIRGSIMELRNRSSFERPFDEAEHAISIEAEHIKWWNDVDEYLSNCEQTQAITKLHQVTLIVLRFESIIALHRSVLATSQRDASYNAALQRCISASRSIINTLHRALQGFGAFDGSPGQSGYETTPLLWPSFTWAVWMSAFIVIFAANECQMSSDVACRLAERSIDILRHLSLRGTNWPEACIVAIRNLVARLNERSRNTTRSSTVEPPRLSRPPTQPLDVEFTSGMFNAAATQPAWPSNRFQPRTTHDATHELAYSQYPVDARTSIPPHHVSFQQMQSSIQQPLHPAATFAPFSAGVQEAQSLSGTHLTGAGSFLGIAQQLSDDPRAEDEIVHLFNGEDMGFWMGQDFGFS